MEKQMNRIKIATQLIKLAKTLMGFDEIIDTPVDVPLSVEVIGIQATDEGSEVLLNLNEKQAKINLASEDLDLGKYNPEFAGWYVAGIDIDKDAGILVNQAGVLIADNPEFTEQFKVRMGDKRFLFRKPR
jgi:hypothetical protein